MKFLIATTILVVVICISYSDAAGKDTKKSPLAAAVPVADVEKCKQACTEAYNKCTVTPRTDDKNQLDECNTERFMCDGKCDDPDAKKEKV